MTGQDWLTSRPIAHRGLHDEAGRPENSLPAFRHAVEQGVPFEFDVQLTRDGRPVVLHDADLLRVAQNPAKVSDLDWETVREVRISESGDRIPSLDEVLEVVDGQVPVVVDVRRWSAKGGAGLETVVADRLRDYGHAESVVLQSFDPRAVFRLRKLTDLRVGQISGALHSAGPVVSAIGRTMLTNVVSRPDFVSYEIAELPSVFAAFWRKLGLPLIGWTVHSKAEEARAVELVDNYFFSGFLPTPEA